MKNNLKKILIGCALIFICTGCGNSSFEEKTPDIDLFDSKIDYILFRDKKIYLSQNLEDYIFQFKGLGCKFRAPYSQISSDMSIDNINDESHAFYSLSSNSSYNEGHIRCHAEKGSGDNEFDVYLDADSTLDKSDILYTDMEILQWEFYPGFADDEIKIFIDGESLSILSIESENVSTKNDIIRLMGSNYEVDKGVYDDDYESFIYSINDIKYKFSFDDDNLLYKLEINIF